MWPRNSPVLITSSGPRTIEQLAADTSTNADALYRLLRALASVGIFAEGPARQFELTPIAEALQSDAPRSKRALAMMSGEEQFRAYAEIDYSIQTGKKRSTTSTESRSSSIWAKLDKARIFDAAMVGIHGRETASDDAYDWSRSDEWPISAGETGRSSSAAAGHPI